MVRAGRRTNLRPAPEAQHKIGCVNPPAPLFMKAGTEGDFCLLATWRDAQRIANWRA